MIEVVSAAAQEAVTPGQLVVLAPREGFEVTAGSPVQFSWLTMPGAAAYRLELRSAARVVLNAVVGAGVAAYTSPPWALEGADTELRRVVAIDARARPIARSDWSTIPVANPRGSS